MGDKTALEKFYSRLPPPRSQCFTGASRGLLEIVANAACDWIYSGSSGPRNRNEAILCNWLNYEAEGEGALLFNPDKFEDTDVGADFLEVKP